MKRRMYFFSLFLLFSLLLTSCVSAENNKSHTNLTKIKNNIFSSRIFTAEISYTAKIKYSENDSLVFQTVFIKNITGVVSDYGKCFTYSCNVNLDGEKNTENYCYSDGVLKRSDEAEQKTELSEFRQKFMTFCFLDLIPYIKFEKENENSYSLSHFNDSDIQKIIKIINEVINLGVTNDTVKSKDFDYTVILSDGKIEKINLYFTFGYKNGVLPSPLECDFEFSCDFYYE